MFHKASARFFFSNASDAMNFFQHSLESRNIYPLSKPTQRYVMELLYLIRETLEMFACTRKHSNETFREVSYLSLGLIQHLETAWIASHFASIFRQGVHLFIPLQSESFSVSLSEDLLQLFDTLPKGEVEQADLTKFKEDFEACLFQ